jgi:hypothetical protein
MRVKTGRCFVSLLTARGHILAALHRRWRFEFVVPPGKLGFYRRLYVGPLEIEWSNLDRKLPIKSGVDAPAAPHPDHWICGQPNCAPCAARGAGGVKGSGDAS